MKRAKHGSRAKQNHTQWTWINLQPKFQTIISRLALPEMQKMTRQNEFRQAFQLSVASVLAGNGYMHMDEITVNFDIQFHLNSY